MRLLIFNPETEYALASGAYFYTPPARVDKIRREMQLLPEAWAVPGDIILVDDKDLLCSPFRLVGWKELKELFIELSDLEVDPWGWNTALIRRLQDAGVPKCKLPDEMRMQRIRELAHRNTTIVLNALWNEKVDSCLRVDLPSELKTIDECMAFHSANPDCWLKAPWSSSGRGVINTAADMTVELVRQWCSGILRRQGSVMGETCADRIADFASEWYIDGGKAVFLGISCFSTSNRGKYISNEIISQQEMAKRFNSLSSIPIDDVIDIQKGIIENVLTGYSGPCGVDMLIERSGSLRPFVEINLRRTMGMIGLEMTGEGLSS